MNDLRDRRPAARPIEESNGKDARREIGTLRATGLASQGSDFSTSTTETQVNDLSPIEAICAASLRMLHRMIDARAEEALHFIARSVGQNQRRQREFFDSHNNGGMK
jgi:hypothetical protein